MARRTIKSSISGSVSRELKKIGRLVAAQRKRLGLGQADFARRIGLDTETLRRVERASAAATVAAYLTALCAVRGSDGHAKRRSGVRRRTP
jgi:ribosome-binding protein aMBF1 (putative translation factor)